MKLLVCCILAAIAFSSSAAENATNSGQAIVVKYCLEPFRTFEIAGTTSKGIRLEDLEKALREHQSTHRDAQYELVAEVKCVPAQSSEIVETFKKAGTILIHYWAPVSDITTNSPPGPYGAGFVDILRNTRTYQP